MPKTLATKSHSIGSLGGAPKLMKEEEAVFL